MVGFAVASHSGRKLTSVCSPPFVFFFKHCQPFFQFQNKFSVIIRGIHRFVAFSHKVTDLIFIAVVIRLVFGISFFTIAFMPDKSLVLLYRLRSNSLNMSNIKIIFGFHVFLLSVREKRTRTALNDCQSVNL